MKFGGTSLSSPARIRRAAATVLSASADGVPPVVVVSARGGTTDSLLAEVDQISPAGDRREIDQLLITGEAASAAILAMSIQNSGQPAVSLVGAQTGIAARGVHGEGRVEGIDAGALRAVQRQGRVAVVAGFHGVNSRGDVVTFGRGGSDTTAVAVAAALGARRCEIYTDVDGVFTADPRVVSSARRLPVLPSPLMLEMAYGGATVLHPRAVALAGRCSVELEVRNSLREADGTVVTPELNGDHMLEPEESAVALAHTRNTARVVVRNSVPAVDCTADVLGELGERAVPVDVLVRSGDAVTGFTLDFTVPHEHLGDLQEITARLGLDATVDREIGTVSVVGTGMLDRPACTARVIRALAAADITIGSVTTSQWRTAATVPLRDIERAVEVLHRDLGLHRPSSNDLLSA